jgi:hypothetical protein
MGRLVAGGGARIDVAVGGTSPRAASCKDGAMIVGMEAA